MKLLNLFINYIRTSKGLILFLIGLILVWLLGYYLIEFMIHEEWKRYYIQLLFSRTTLVLSILSLIAASIPHATSFDHSIQKTALDLSVFRILFFGFFAVGLFFNPSAVSDQVEPFVNLPQSAQVDMPFMGWYPKIIPINSTMITIASVLFYISIFTSLLGFKTRWSILIFTVSLFYLFIIPNLYGKVNHNHHLIWIPAILAFSPCADRFSIDSLLRGQSNTQTINSQEKYKTPFIFIWVLMGLIYFFPGFWKVWSHGLDWALTDNIRNQLYYKWFQLGDVQSWTPFFRIDKYPIMYKSIGIFTIIFELSFIPLILNKSTRKLGIAMGLLFHIGTYLFMHIFFIVLVWAYLSFVNWHNLSIFKTRGYLNTSINADSNNPLVNWIGSLLVISCLIFGFGKWYSYPFTVYPTFDTIVKEETDHLKYSCETVNGELIPLSINPLHDVFTSPRYWKMEYNLIESYKKGNLNSELLNKFISIYSNEAKESRYIHVYLTKESIVPEKRDKTKQTLIYTKELN